MNPLVPSYLQFFVLGGTLATLAAVFFGVQRALKSAQWPAGDRRRAVGSIAVLLGAWFLVALLTSWWGFYKPAGGPPTIQYGLLLPIMVGIALFWWWPTLRRVLDSVPQARLVGVQFYRALGLIFLVLYAGGRLPGVFAWPAGTGDFLVGLAAPAVGFAYARKSLSAAWIVRAWNFFGIADLVVAVTTGFLSSPSPLQMLSFDAPNQLITAFPLVMIPVFLVPLSILLHLASLRKLRRAESGGQNHLHAIVADARS
jgi:hypothetical protein